jgi:hypothetical protein
MARRKGDKRANSDLQSITQKTKHRTIGTPLKQGDFGWSGRVSSSCSTCGAIRVTVKRHEHHLIWKSYWKPVYVNKYK